MTRRRLVEWIGGIAVVGLVALGVGGWLIRHTIQTGVNEVVAEARAGHAGSDTVTALIAVMELESLPLKRRNGAVWALGQLRDPRAVAALEAHYTGGECDHSNRLCQRELRKALELCRGNGPDFLRIQITAQR